MSVGTLTICILGLAYVVWSIYAIRDLINKYNISFTTSLWALLTFISILVGFISLLYYLINNWDKPLW